VWHDRHFHLPHSLVRLGCTQKLLLLQQQLLLPVVT
jgi:hypothetical protein